MAEQKPEWPYRHIVSGMFAHATGRWAKKIRGRHQYFGPWEDPEAALRLYQRIGPDLHAGRVPAADVRPAGDMTIADLCNRYLADRKTLVEQGELSHSSWLNSRKVAAEVLAATGRGQMAAGMGPQHFSRIRRHFGSRWSSHTIRVAVGIVRAMFRWAYDSELLEHPPRYGPDFKRPRRFDPQQDGTYEPGELATLIDASRDNARMQACLLLGINAAYGQSDCARLPSARVNLAEGVVAFPRPKTGIARAVTLWPETAAALERAMAERPKPATPDAAGLAILSATGRRLVRDVPAGSTDLIAQQFRNLLDHCGIRRRGFYALRHTFRTLADETELQHPICRIMGHALPGMSAVYVHAVEAKRLKRVTDHVRQRVLG